MDYILKILDQGPHSLGFIVLTHMFTSFISWSLDPLVACKQWVENLVIFICMEEHII